jgi:hypothetical protein
VLIGSSLPSPPRELAALHGHGSKVAALAAAAVASRVELCDETASMPTLMRTDTSESANQDVIGASVAAATAAAAANKSTHWAADTSAELAALGARKQVTVFPALQALPFPARMPEPTAPLPQRRIPGPFSDVPLLLMFNSAEFIGNLAVLERWYAPHFNRVVAYCDVPGNTTIAEAAALAKARGAPTSIVSRVSFVHAGTGLTVSGGITRADIAGGSFSQVALAHYLARLHHAGELASVGSSLTGVFFLCDDALLSSQVLGRMDGSLPLVGVAHEGGRRIDFVGSGRDRSWSWWRMN